ncbi:MAG TPA: GNA1162 family protein [Candidatus Binataceae bacterium]|nr:GNA1162 family protein [Candidatus Binataceae bacterium]
MIILMMIVGLLAGCSAAASNYDTRPFFLPEQDAARHGRKTWFDHLVEFDPGRAKLKIAPDYDARPPERIAVLPFVDHGNAQYRVDKIALTRRVGTRQAEWAWTYANRLRRSMAGQLSEREFTIIPIPEVDVALQDHGIDTWKKLMDVPPQELGRWLGADTVVYGEVMDYDAYYALLVSAWEVGVKVQLVSTRDGRQLFESSDSRYSVNLQPAFDMVDFGVNSGLSLLQLRDVTLARAEDEVSREIALRIPVSYRALADLQMAARTRQLQETAQVRAEHSNTLMPVTFGAPMALDPRIETQEDPPAHK